MKAILVLIAIISVGFICFRLGVDLKSCSVLSPVVLEPLNANKTQPLCERQEVIVQPTPVPKPILKHASFFPSSDRFHPHPAKTIGYQSGSANCFAFPTSIRFPSNSFSTAPVVTAVILDDANSTTLVLGNVTSVGFDCSVENGTSNNPQEIHWQAFLSPHFLFLFELQAILANLKTTQNGFRSKIHEDQSLFLLSVLLLGFASSLYFQPPKPKRKLAKRVVPFSDTLAVHANPLVSPSDTLPVHADPLVSPEQ